MSERYIGLMSGTSMDAVDAALVAFHEGRPELEASLSLPLPEPVRAALQALARGQRDDEIEQLGRLDATLGRLFAEAARGVLAAAKQGPEAVMAIGSHGQTVRHRPEADPPFTLQVGDPNVVAELTGITTVADFRRRDLAAGGQGAPLAPAFHARAFASADEVRVVANIGGIANITVLPPGDEGPVVGFDSGPGNTLLDAWVQRHRGTGYDADGAWAGQGALVPALLDRLLADPYFQRPPPKSTGPEHFSLPWLEQCLSGIEPAPAPADVQATLLELTAISLARSVETQVPGARRLLVCGGGARNGRLMQRLAARLPDTTVETTAAHGIEPEWVEAAAFAWLARQTLRGEPGNLPSVTGARRAAVLGAIYPGTHRNQAG